MDEFYYQLGQIIGIILILYVCLNMAFRYLLPKIKGNLGEKQVTRILNKLDKNNYIVINDVILEKKDGLTQIDHIVVSTYGIFTIETKNYKGKIYGGEFSNVWTQYIGGKKYEFMNPIKQNYAHEKALEELTKQKIIPIVAISDNAEIKVKSKKPVVNFSKLMSTINNYQERCCEYIEAEEIATAIINANVSSKETRKEHIRMIEKKKSMEPQKL